MASEPNRHAAGAEGTEKPKKPVDQIPPKPKGRLGWLLFRIAVLVVTLGLAVWLARPAPIDPAPYDPPRVAGLEPGSGRTADDPWLANDRLAQAEPLGAGTLLGPEDVTVDADGSVYTGTVDGKVWRIDPAGETTVVANTGGRPLGIRRLPKGALVVADSRRGLIQIKPGGEIRELAKTAAGRAFRFTDALDVAADGTVYFSDASDKFGTDDYLFDLLEGRPHGRLLRLRPGAAEAEVLLDGLYFANGIAVARDQQFVLVNETYRYRITRYWLAGERAGTHEVFVDELPGFPDNLSCDDQGHFWVALFTVRNPTLDRMSPYPWLKAQVAKLPRAFWPRPRPYALIAHLDEQGKVVETFQDPTGLAFREVTSAVHREGVLYFGSLHNDRVGRLKLGPAEGESP